MEPPEIFLMAGISLIIVMVIVMFVTTRNWQLWGWPEREL